MANVCKDTPDNLSGNDTLGTRDVLESILNNGPILELTEKDVSLNPVQPIRKILDGRTVVEGRAGTYQIKGICNSNPSGTSGMDELDLSAYR